jgi:hypothetical protein
MMKLLIVLASALLAQAGTVPRNLAGTAIHGAAYHQKLLSKAVRVNRQGERILNEGQQNEALTSAHSIQFDTCVALKTEPTDNEQFIFSEGLSQYTSNGNIVVEQSYVLFSVCKTIYCDYYAKGDNLYMIDLATYMDTIAEFYAERQENYCAACLNSYQYCQ